MQRKEIKHTVRGFMKEFKEFALKEATLGVAVGIMLGAAIKGVVDSLVNDILTPPIAKIISGIDFSDMFFVLSKNTYESLDDAKLAGEVVIMYGNFINSFISFLITASVLFVLVYQGSKLFKKKEEKEQRNTKECMYCKSEIHKDAIRCPHCTSKIAH